MYQFEVQLGHVPSLDLKGLGSGDRLGRRVQPDILPIPPADTLVLPDLAPEGVQLPASVQLLVAAPVQVKVSPRLAGTRRSEPRSTKANRSVVMDGRMAEILGVAEG